MQMREKECYYNNYNKYDVDSQDMKILKKIFSACSFIYIIDKESKTYNNILTQINALSAFFCKNILSNINLFINLTQSLLHLTDSHCSTVLSFISVNTVSAVAAAINYSVIKITLMTSFSNDFNISDFSSALFSLRNFLLL